MGQGNNNNQDIADKLNDTLTSQHIFNLFFHTGWFEYEVASLLSTWQYAKEIRMNVKFPYNAERNPKNEIDLIVNTGNRLLFVECKTQINDLCSNEGDCCGEM